MPLMGSMKIAMLTGGALCGAFIVGALSKSDAATSQSAGRYQVVSNDGALFRMDTSTGEIVVCTAGNGRDAQVTCGFIAGQRAMLIEAAHRANEFEAR